MTDRRMKIAVVIGLIWGGFMLVDLIAVEQHRNELCRAKGYYEYKDTMMVNGELYLKCITSAVVNGEPTISESWVKDSTWWPFG